MSIDAQRWVWRLDKTLVTPTQKFLLLSLADRAGEYNECWPSLKRLEQDTGFNRKTIIKARDELIEKGLIKYTGEYKGRTKQIPIIQILCGDMRENSSPITQLPPPTSPSNDTEITMHEQNENNTSSEKDPNLGTVQNENSTTIGTGKGTNLGTRNLSIEPNNSNNKTTTTRSIYYRDAQEIDISKIEHIGMTVQHVEQALHHLPHNMLQTSINRFAEGLKNNPTVKAYRSPLSVFMGVVCKGKAWAADGYKGSESPLQSNIETKLGCENAYNAHLQKLVSNSTNPKIKESAQRLMLKSHEAKN